MPGYLYLLEEVPLQNEKSGPWTKIGISSNPPIWRVDANLKRGNPRDLRIRAVYEFHSEADARAAEMQAHRFFVQFLREKEWFNRDWNVIETMLKTIGGAICRSDLSN